MILFECNLICNSKVRRLGTILNKPLIGRIFLHCIGRVEVGCSADKSCQNGYTFKRLIDNKHMVVTLSFNAKMVLANFECNLKN